MVQNWCFTVAILAVCMVQLCRLKLHLNHFKHYSCSFYQCSYINLQRTQTWGIRKVTEHYHTCKHEGDYCLTEKFLISLSLNGVWHVFSQCNSRKYIVRLWRVEENQRILKSSARLCRWDAHINLDGIFKPRTNELLLSTVIWIWDSFTMISPFLFSHNRYHNYIVRHVKVFNSAKSRYTHVLKL